MAFRVPEENRFMGPVGSNNGAFQIKHGLVIIRCIASDGGGWEHVSVSLSVKRCPDWEEMCAVKDLFWSKEDCVVQYHPPESEYVNNHAYVLHLWRKTNKNFETPPSILIGIKKLGTFVK